MKVWENNFRYTKTNRYVNTKADLDLLEEKGAYLMDSFERSDEIHSPDKEHFYSELYETGIADKVYARADIIWKRFNINNLGDYRGLHLMSDAYLIIEAFENLRDMCLNHYGLDPTYLQHY